MVTLVVLLKVVGIAVLFGVLCNRIGSIGPSSFYFANYSLQLQRIVFGISALIALYRLPFRHDFSVHFIDAFFILILGVVLVRDALRILRRRKAVDLPNARGGKPSVTLGDLASFVVASSPLVLVVLLPFLSYGAFYFYNHGPDLDGNLMTSRYILSELTWNDTLTNFALATGHQDWWRLWDSSFLVLPDFTETTAIYFFPHSHRWGHAVLTAFFSRLTAEPVWLIFASLALSSAVLTSLLLRDKLIHFGLTTTMAGVVTILVLSSHSYVLMYYEGILVQWIATPLVFFVLANIASINLQMTLRQLFFLSTIITALISTYGEGVQILGFFALALIITKLLVDFAYRQKQDLTPAFRMLAIAGLTILLNPVAVVDFLTWSYGRLLFDFDGGALHFDWSVLSLLFPFPLVSLEGPTYTGVNIYFPFAQFGRMLEALLLLILSAHLLKEERTSGILLLTISICLFVVCITNHLYAVWKVALLLQPLFLILLAKILNDRLAPRAFNLAVCLVALLSAASMLKLMSEYVEHAQPARIVQFDNNASQFSDRDTPIITPSQSRIYIQLGMQMPLNWVNGGFRGPNWEPNFKVTNLQDALVYTYFDCDAEGSERCHGVQRHNPDLRERRLQPTTMMVREVLGEDGVIDRQKVNDAITQMFGVKALGDPRPVIFQNMKDQQSQKDLAATTQCIVNAEGVANFAINGAFETIGVPFSKTLDREGVSTLDDGIWSVGGTEGTTLSILQAETLSSSGRKYAEWQIPAETGYYELLQKVSDVPLRNLQYEFGFTYKLTEPMKGLGLRLVLEFDEPRPDGERYVFLNLGEVEPSVDWKEFGTNVSFPTLDYERVKSVWISFQNISPSPKTFSVTEVRLGPETEKYVWRKEGEPAATCAPPLLLQ